MKCIVVVDVCCPNFNKIYIKGIFFLLLLLFYCWIYLFSEWNVIKQKQDKLTFIFQTFINVLKLKTTAKTDCTTHAGLMALGYCLATSYMNMQHMNVV